MKAPLPQKEFQDAVFSNLLFQKASIEELAKMIAMLGGQLAALTSHVREIRSDQSGFAMRELEEQDASIVTAEQERLVEEFHAAQHAEWQRQVSARRSADEA